MVALISSYDGQKLWGSATGTALKPTIGKLVIQYCQQRIKKTVGEGIIKSLQAETQKSLLVSAV